MKNYFEQAYEILSEVYGGAFLKIAMQRLPEDAENRSLVTLLCYGTIENDARYHAEITRLTDKKPLKKHVRLILKMAMYLLEGVRRPAYATVDTAVEFSKKIDRGASAGLINAVLRRFLREGMEIPLPEKRYERIAVQSGFPLFAVKRLFHTYGEEAEGIFSRRPPVTSVRFPAGEDGAAYFKNEGVNYTPSPFPNLFFAENFRRNADFDAGKYTFQSVGSVAICDMISPCEKLLDVCAAPGGKSVLLSEKCAFVTAGELHPQRVKLIESYAARMRRDNVFAVEKDATLPREEWNGAFDGVLCDVPCSGYGVISENPDILLRAGERNFASLPPLQLKILLASAEFVKPGGCLYYSTCTLFSEENDGVVSAFLKARSDFAAQVLSSPLGGRKMKYGLQFLPQNAFNAGFYFAKLIKRN